MSYVFCIMGAVLGGALFHIGGLLAGAMIGWLCGGLLELRQRQDVTERELVRLREQLIEQSGIVGKDNVPQTAARPDVPASTEPALLPDEMAASVFFQPVEKPAIVRSPEPDLEPPDIPADPSALESAIRRLFSGDNLLVKLGVVILFFGVAFLVKYAAQRGLFPLELRLAGAALGGCALLATGWRLRNRRPVYAQVIQGGGIGIIYLTTYAAMRLYHLLPLSVGFGLLVATCALAGFLAVVQDSRALAVMASTGGFLAPELASIGSGSHVVLFSYYAVLNLGVLGIARYRAWRELNLLGFMATFIVGALWGGRFYRPEYLLTVEPFLVLFFLIYAVLPVLYARKEQAGLDGCLDVVLVFGTPLVTFAFQRQLVQGFEYGLAWSSLVLGCFYLVVSVRLFHTVPQRMRMLAEAFLAIGTLFATLTIPLALDGRWTAAAWSLEGAALVWAGLRQQRLLARLFGYMLLVGSGIAFISEAGMKSGPWPILNGFYIGCLMVSGAALYSAWLLSRTRIVLAVPERCAEIALFAWGMTWWFAGGLNEIADHTLGTWITGVQLLFFAFSCLGSARLHRRLDWRLLQWIALGLLPAMLAITLLQFLADNACPSFNGGWFGWPVAFCAWYLILKGCEKQENGLHPVAHAAPLWLLSFLGAWELSGRIHQHLPGMETWSVSAWGVVPALVALLINRYGERLPRTIIGHAPASLGVGCIPLAAAAWLWLLYANLTQSGNPWPLPYLPLLNPLDGATLLVLVALVVCYRAVQTELPTLLPWLPRHRAVASLAATLFVWLNAILLRSTHHWCGVPFTVHGLFASLTVQATLSICWCLLAFAAMTLATRRGLRQIWLIGAGLLGAVVAKLFLVDLAGHGSVARIVSFVVVGLLILLIGWFSPVPPHTDGRVQ